MIVIPVPLIHNVEDIVVKIKIEAVLRTRDLIYELIRIGIQHLLLNLTAAHNVQILILFKQVDVLAGI